MKGTTMDDLGELMQRLHADLVNTTRIDGLADRAAQLLGRFDALKEVHDELRALLDRYAHPDIEALADSIATRALETGEHYEHVRGTLMRLLDDDGATLSEDLP